MIQTKITEIKKRESEILDPTFAMKTVKRKISYYPNDSNEDHIKWYRRALFWPCKQCIAMVYFGHINNCIIMFYFGHINNGIMMLYLAI